MTETAGRAVLWCRHCDQPVKRAGDGGPLGKAVHAGTGDELCADGQHAAAPTGVNPELEAIARRMMGDYPEYEVSVHFGLLFRAVLRGQLTPVHVEATTEEELRAAIERDIRMRELAAGGAVYREVQPPIALKAVPGRLPGTPGTVR